MEYKKKNSVIIYKSFSKIKNILSEYAVKSMIFIRERGFQFYQKNNHIKKQRLMRLKNYLPERLINN